MSIPPLSLLHDFGEDWQIQQEPGGLWVAIERPVVPVVRFYLAETPDQLRELLEADPRHPHPEPEPGDFRPQPSGPPDL